MQRNCVVGIPFMLAFMVFMVGYPRCLQLSRDRTAALLMMTSLLSKVPEGA